MKRLTLALFLSAPLLLASPALALFDVHVLTGQRAADFKINNESKTESGNELKVAAHLDPIPLVPIGFGLALGQTTWDKSDKLGYQSLDGNEISVEIEAWLPIDLGGLEFFGKVGYTILGAYTAEYQSELLGPYKTLYQPKGSYLAVGAKYLLLLRLGVMLEYEQANRTLEFDEAKNLPAGVDAALAKKDITASSSSFLLGVQAGI